MSKNSPYDLRYYHANKDRINARRKELRQAWTEDQKEAARVRQRNFYANHPGYVGDDNKKRASYKEAKRKEREYGLTPGAWDTLFAGQGFRCAVCRSDDPGDKRRAWRTDHDHVTGKVRGILCHHCNVVLGHVDDDPQLLRALAAYVEHHWSNLSPDAIASNMEKNDG